MASACGPIVQVDLSTLNQKTTTTPSPNKAIWSCTSLVRLPECRCLTRRSKPRSCYAAPTLRKARGFAGRTGHERSSWFRVRRGRSSLSARHVRVVAEQICPTYDCFYQPRACKRAAGSIGAVCVATSQRGHGTGDSFLSLSSSLSSPASIFTRQLTSRTMPVSRIIVRRHEEVLRWYRSGRHVH